MALQESRITEACAKMRTTTLEALEWHTVRTLDQLISKGCVLVTEEANLGRRAAGRRPIVRRPPLPTIDVGRRDWLN